MKKVDLAYMAGFFDGEGCIFIYRKTDGNYQFCCTVTQTIRWILELFKFNFGGSIHITGNKKRYKDMGWHVCWEWKIGDQKALSFLKTILPYLVLKKGEATVAVKFQTDKKPQGIRFKTPEEKDNARAVQEAQRLLIKNLKS